MQLDSPLWDGSLTSQASADDDHLDSEMTSASSPLTDLLLRDFHDFPSFSQTEVHGLQWHFGFRGGVETRV